MQDYVSLGSKKRTLDMKTQPDPAAETNQMKELSPVEHINKYFKKLKRAREEDADCDESSETVV